MHTFTAEHGHFCLDGKPQLIQAGEFHYFRTPRDQWRNRLDLLKAAGFNAVAAYMPWIWHQLDEDVSDFLGQSHPMRDLAGFLDLATEMGLLIIARPGPYIMAETINEGIPAWVFRMYPQTAYISQDGKTQNVASYLHPDFLALVKKWYQAIFTVLAPRQITRGGNIIMIQLDNEIGMIQWVRNIMDVNLDTLGRFAAYLAKAYGEDLASRYPTDQLESFLKDGLMNPVGNHAANIVIDYMRFYREYSRDYMAFLVSEAKLNGLEVPPVLNIHGFMNGGKTFPIGLSQLIEAMRLDGMISATDVYPGLIGEGNFHQLLMVNEITKALHNPDQALFSIEFQAGGNQDFGGGQTSLYDLHTRLCISSGMRAINHYLFFGGENDPILSPVKRHDWGPPVRTDGSLRAHYHRYPKLSRVLKAYGEALVQSKPETNTTIGFLLDHFMTEVSNASTKAATQIITHQREEVLFDMIGRGLALTHRAFDALDLETGTLDPERTPLCWVMMEKQCSAAVQQKLVEYVRHGGKLVLAGRMCVEDFENQSCTLLKDALAITNIQTDPPFTPTLIHAFNQRDIPVSFVEDYTGNFDQVFATRLDGKTVGFIKTLAEGKVMMLGAALEEKTLEDLDVMRQMAASMECPTPFALSSWADVRMSRGDKGNFLFINNYQDDPVETSITYWGETLFGGHPIVLAARSGTILPIDWQIGPGVRLNYATSEIIEVAEDGENLSLKTAQQEFFAELTLSGYTCDQGIADEKTPGRFRLHGKEGILTLRKIN